MPLYLDQLLDDMFTNRMVKKVVQNPILTAIIIVLIFVIIAHFMFYDADLDNTVYAKTLVKFGIYGFVGSLAVIFLHYKNTEDDYQKRVYGKTENDIMREVQQVNGAMEEAEDPAPAPAVAAPETPAAVPVPEETRRQPASVPEHHEDASRKPQPPTAPQVQVIVQQPREPKPTPPRPLLRTPISGK